MAIAFTPIPAWAIQATTGALSFFEAVALAGLEGQWIRLSAATQKTLLGAVVFGKQEFCVGHDGNVKVCRSTCFGADFETDSYGLARINQALSAGKQLSPGTYGGKYI